MTRQRFSGLRNCVRSQTAATVVRLREQASHNRTNGAANGLYIIDNQALSEWRTACQSNDMLNDLRYALRTLSQNRSFAATLATPSFRHAAGRGDPRPARVAN